MVDESDKRSCKPLTSGSQEAGKEVDVQMQADLDGEAITHLLISCEGLSAHVGAWLENSEASLFKLIVDDLSRMRNTLVILDKPAGQFVLAEILNLLDRYSIDKSVSSDDLESILVGLARELTGYVDSLRQLANVDCALVMVPLINDCRACRDEMLVSDALMLAAGVEPQCVRLESDAVQHFNDQQQHWIGLVNEHHAHINDLLSEWHNDISCVDTVDALIDHLDSLVSLSVRYTSLISLKPLFQAASVVLHAIYERQLRYGPALRSLFVQLEQAIAALRALETPDDLLPFDLLRNFLYYVAQVDLDTAHATSLKRRYRLERIRQDMHSAQSSDTLTINAGYHLATSIRATIARESASLKLWLEQQFQADSNASHDAPPGTVRLRVRVQQLQPVLTLLGANEAVTRLQAIVRNLHAIGDLQSIGETSRTEMINSLASFDTLLFQLARQHVVRGSQKLANNTASPDFYTDMAVDACLREARSELLEFSNQLMSRLKRLELDEFVTEQLTQRLDNLHWALKVLPLPGVSDLLVSLKDRLLPKVCVSVSAERSELLNDLAKKCEFESSVIDPLAHIIDLLDEYLSYAMLPHADVTWHLGEARKSLDTIIQNLSTDNINIVDVSSSTLTGEFENDALLLIDDHSLTLEVDDYLQIDELDDDHCVTLDNTVESFYGFTGCMEGLDRLQACVKRALTPRAGTDAWLPNDKMLRALHDLTVNAQGMEVNNLIAHLQPLQRTALVLHRNGRHFNAHETRFIGELANAFRFRMEAAKTGVEIGDQVLDIESRLSGVLQSALSGTRDVIDAMPQKLTVSGQAHSLDNMFYDEASELLRQIHGLLQSGSADTEALNTALALLHTLKGNARMTGRLAMSECIHALEADVQSLADVESQLDAIKQHHEVLLEFLEKPSAKWQANNSALKDLSLKLFPDGVDPSVISETEESNRAISLAQKLNVGQARLGKELVWLTTIAREIKADVMQWRDMRCDRSSNADRPSDDEEYFNNLASLNDKLLSAIKKADIDNLRNTKASVGLQQGLIRSRMVRADTLGNRLKEIVKEATQHLDCKVMLSVSGGDLMIDKALSRQLAHALDHLTRNAVIHGIESSKERIARHKSDTGTISLEISTDGNSLHVSLTDDGRGIDVKSINSARTLNGEACLEGGSDLLQLLCTSGFSSIENAGALHGHGLGLSAVQTVVNRLGGSLDLENREQHGISVKMCIPQTPIVGCVVLVRDGTQLFGFPASQVKSVAITDSNNKSNTDDNSGEAKHLLLADLLGYDASTRSLRSDQRSDGAHSSTAQTTLRVVSDNNAFNLVVEAVVGYREMVLQSLNEKTRKIKRFSAVGINHNGEQALIVDLQSILQAGQLVSNENQHSPSPDYS